MPSPEPPIPAEERELLLDSEPTWIEGPAFQVVAKAETASVKGLDFAKADTNKDGRLDRAEYEAALFHLERTTPDDHVDGLAIWRLLELKKNVYRLPDADPELVPWQERLDEIAGTVDADELLLAEIEATGADGQVRDPSQLELFGTLLTELKGMRQRAQGDEHRIRTPAGVVYAGTWEEIVRQMKNDGHEVPATDPERFIRASADAGLLRIIH